MTEKKHMTFVRENWDEIKVSVVLMIRGPKVPCPCGHAHSRVMQENADIDLDDVIQLTIHQLMTIKHMDRVNARKAQQKADEEHDKELMLKLIAKTAEVGAYEDL